MATITKTTDDNKLLRSLSKLNFAFLAALAAFNIIFDSGNVLTREAVYHRWMLIAVLFVIFILFWVVAIKSTSKLLVQGGLVLCVLAELLLAGYMTYWERGMASTSTVLYMMPIASIAYTKSRTFTIAASLAAAATYLAAATKYFYDFFNEGYRVQLYGEIFFYSAVFLVTGWVIATLAHSSKK